jgi:putative SOS response-associated peptidase YedK
MMCGRYWIDDGRESVELRGIIEAVNRRVSVEPVKTSGEIFPADIVPVIANNKNMAPTAFAMQWGYTLSDGRRVINARSETAETRPMFADGMRQRRCAVPATNYFEWERAGKTKTKYAIRPTGGALFYMAGIYRIESGRPVFSILTREPADSIAFIHDRMPVILPHDLVRDWTNPNFRAGEILKHAVLDLFHEKADGEEQISMTL